MLSQSEEKFFASFPHDKPAENLKLVAARFDREYGAEPFTLEEVRSKADAVGITIPATVDMTLLQAKDKRKKLFARAGKGKFKPTVHEEVYLETKYSVDKGTKKRTENADARGLCRAAFEGDASASRSCCPILPRGVEQKTALTVHDTRRGLQSARAKGRAKVNVADALNKNRRLVDTCGLQVRKRLRSLTESGRDHVRILLGLPKADLEVEHNIGTLENVVANITDAEGRDYLEEGLKSLQVGALGPCTAFVRAAAIRTIQADIMTKGAELVTSALEGHDPKLRPVQGLDDFAHVKDRTTLLAGKQLGILDKNEKGALTEALDLLNRCGHSCKYRPVAKAAAAFVADITSIVFA